MSSREFKKGDIVRQYKREYVNPETPRYLYRIEGTAYDADTKEEYMVYTAIYADGKTWIRKRSEFEKEVDHWRYPDVTQKYMFEPASEEEIKIAEKPLTDEMKVTWIGHSCFRIEKDGYAVVIDPYGDGSVPGLKPVREEADLVLCSHEHFDHNAIGNVTLRKGAGNPFEIKKIETYHDDVKGAKRGKNTIHILKAGTLKLAHLGDLGCELERDQLDELRGLDCLLVPVGGHYTINAEEAKKLIAEISPWVVVPMHYRDEKAGFGFDEIADLRDWATDFASDLKFSEESSILINGKLPHQTVILKPQNLQ